jgi:hypothetical protein
MSFFANMRAERLIAEIKAAAEDGERDNRKALDRLARLGPAAIPRIIDALASADKQETAGFVTVLSALLDNKTFAAVAEGLKDGNQRTVAAVVWALGSSKNYSPQLLYGLLESPDAPKGPLVNVLIAQKSRLNARDLLKHAYQQ